MVDRLLCLRGQIADLTSVWENQSHNHQQYYYIDLLGRQNFWNIIKWGSKFRGTPYPPPPPLHANCKTIVLICFMLQQLSWLKFICSVLFNLRLSVCFFMKFPKVIDLCISLPFYSFFFEEGGGGLKGCYWDDNLLQVMECSVFFFPRHIPSYKIKKNPSTTYP